MAVYTIERANPLNPIAKCYISTDKLGELNSISATLKYVRYVNSDIDTHQINLESGNDVLTVIKTSQYEYAFSINQESALFKNFLFDSNFFIELTSPTAEEEYILNYYIKPSTITLDNISISTLNTPQYGTIGGKGIVTQSGNCELWSDYDFTVFKTSLTRVYYNSDTVILDGPYNNELAEKIQLAKDNGGGRINLTTTNLENGIGPITFDYNGISISSFNQETEEYVEQYLGESKEQRIINFIGVNNSFAFNGFKFFENDPNNVKEIVINLHNSSPLFKNNYFVNCTFILNGICNLNFNNCSFKDCKIIGDDNCYINFSSSILTNTKIYNFNDVNFYQTGCTNLFIDNVINSKFYTCGLYGDCAIAAYNIYTENTSVDQNVQFISVNLFLNKTFSSEKAVITSSIFDLDKTENSSVKLINCALNKFIFDNNNDADCNVSLGISNCTLLNPVVFNNTAPRVSSLIYSTILGGHAAEDSNGGYNNYFGFEIIANSLLINLLPENADDTILPLEQPITGIVDIRAGSFINNIKIEDSNTVSLITFSNETAPYKHLNGMIKCLRYNITSYGLGSYELLSDLSSYDKDYIIPYIQEKDIFGYIRSESSPVAGCEEFKALANYGGTINLDYSSTAKHILEFNELEKQYQKSIIVNEFNDLKDKNNIPQFTWTKNGEILNSTIVDDGSVCVYEVVLENSGQFIECECHYGGFNLSNNIKLLIAETPIIEYESTKYTVWTNTPFVIPVYIKTSSKNNAILTSKIDWYIQSKNKLPEYINTSYAYDDNGVLRSDFNILIFEKTDSANYFCNFVYLPDDFENSRIIRGVDKNGIENNITIDIKHNVIIDKTLTTSGDIELNEGDILTLSAAIIQGDDVIFEWQKTKDIGLNNWETIYGPTFNNNDYRKTQFTEDRAGTYYRLHAYNLNDLNSDIATEDYSHIITVKVLPKFIDGNSISSNITLFKIPVNTLISDSETLYNPGQNYRVFTFLDNKDIILSNNLIDNIPILHRKQDKDLWENIGNENKLTKKYCPYVFPSDVDIDKYNTNFGVASEEYRLVDNVRYGGYVYVLDLDHLNDNIDFKINKPQITIDLYSTYLSEPNANDNVVFSSLGKTVYTRNNYIAVADPNAFITRANVFSDFDMYINPRLYSNGGQLVWQIDLVNEFVDTPIIQLIENRTNKIALADIEYNSEKNYIRVFFETDDNIILENSFKLNVVGRKNSAVAEEILSNVIYTTEDLNPVDGVITWEVDVPGLFTQQPLVQLYNNSNRQIIANVAYNNIKNSYVFRFSGTETIKSGEIYATFIGKSSEITDSDKIITKTYYNDTIYRYNTNNAFVWKVKYSVDNIRFSECPIVQIYDCVMEGESIDLTKCISDIEYNNVEGSVNIILENIGHGIIDRINAKTLSVTLIGERYDAELAEKQGTHKENVGRVLLYKFDGNAKYAKLVKVVKSPDEVKNGYFGEAIEFDDHGHILISAPGEEFENNIGYERRGSDIVPAYKSDNTLTFSSRGRVYVFNINDLVNAEMFETVPAKQILSNSTAFKTINYNTGNWGDLKDLYRIQSLYVIKDTATNGQKVYEGFADIESYLEYYDFNYTYDFTYRKYFPIPYTAADFMNENSKSEYFSIEYRQLYYTNNMEERYGTAISYTNNILTIGAPYYNANKGMIELWRYDKSLEKYVYSSALKNPYFSNEKMFGINVETGTGYVLATFRQTASAQAVALLNVNASSKFENNNIVIYAKNKSKAKSFGNSMDSYNYTFTIASPTDREIHRYNFNPMAENSKYIELIQSIGLNKFGISSGNNNIVITKDKILAAYNSYGSAISDSYPKENLGEGTNKEDIELKYINSGQGAVLQLTLIGGEYKI